MSTTAAFTPLHHSNQKKNWLTIIIIFVIALIFGGTLFYFLQGTSPSPVVNFSESTPSAQSSNSPKGFSPVDQKTTLAKNILNHFSATTDNNEFYGDYQTCDQENHCQLNLTDYLSNGTDQAAYRYDLSVAWARYQYYQLTHDPAELALLEQDLQTLVNQVLDHPTWVLQTDTFNCLLMADLVRADELDLTIKNLARRLCATADFERHPDSNVSYDQHQHDLLTFYLNDNAEVNHLPVTPLVDQKPDPASLENFSPEQLQSAIDSLIRQLANGKRTPLNSRVSSPADQNDFMTREIIAAIDQRAASQILTDQSATAAAALHALILTEETLNWFNAQPSNFSDLDICLLKANLSQYLADNPNVITTEQFDRILNYGPLTFDDNLLCQIALQSSPNLSAQNAQEIYQIFQNLATVNQQEYGYVGPSGNNFIFDVNKNAFLAGLLAKQN